MFNMTRIFVLLFIMVHFVFAQTTLPKENFYTLNLVKIYFLLLLFATILNRILEYLKVFITFLNNKWHFLTPIFTQIQHFIIHKLKKLQIEFNELKLKEKIQLYTISFIMQFLGFVLGIILAFLFNINVLSSIGILKNHQMWGLFVSGLLIGAGVEPVHAFFRIAQEKRKLKKLFSEIRT